MKALFLSSVWLNDCSNGRDGQMMGNNDFLSFHLNKYFDIFRNWILNTNTYHSDDIDYYPPRMIRWASGLFFPHPKNERMEKKSLKIEIALEFVRCFIACSTRIKINPLYWNRFIYCGCEHCIEWTLNTGAHHDNPMFRSI